MQCDAQKMVLERGTYSIRNVGKGKDSSDHTEGHA